MIEAVTVIVITSVSCLPSWIEFLDGQGNPESNLNGCFRGGMVNTKQGTACTPRRGQTLMVRVQGLEFRPES